MKNADSFLFELFRGLIDRDSQLYCECKAGVSGVILADDVVRFTVQGLHNLMPPDSGLTYGEFRSCLYAGAVNQGLSRLGYQVEIYRSTGKVDSSWYQLKEIV